MGKSLKIYFTDFWPKFDVNINFFTILLKNNNIDYIVTPDNPDLLFFSSNGNENKRFNCKKIFYTGENIRPLKNNDIILNVGFDYINQQDYFRLPLWYLCIDWYNNNDLRVITQSIPLSWLKTSQFYKYKFCAVVVSNPYCVIRNNLFYALSSYKKVDSLGFWKNNVGGPIAAGNYNKIKHLSNYKFTICCENSSHPGYLTEKLLHAKVAGCVPIYYGDTSVGVDMNPESFINVHDYEKDINKLFEHIISIDKFNLFEKYTRAPILTDHQIENSFSLLKQFANKILSLI